MGLGWVEVGWVEVTRQGIRPPLLQLLNSCSCRSFFLPCLARFLISLSPSLFLWPVPSCQLHPCPATSSPVRLPCCCSSSLSAYLPGAVPPLLLHLLSLPCWLLGAGLKAAQAVVTSALERLIRGEYTLGGGALGKHRSSTSDSGSRSGDSPSDSSTDSDSASGLESMGGAVASQRRRLQAGAEQFTEGGVGSEQGPNPLDARIDLEICNWLNITACNTTGESRPPACGRWKLVCCLCVCPGKTGLWHDSQFFLSCQVVNGNAFPVTHRPVDLCYQLTSHHREHNITPRRSAAHRTAPHHNIPARPTHLPLLLLSFLPPVLSVQCACLAAGRASWLPLTTPLPGAVRWW